MQLAMLALLGSGLIAAILASGFFYAFSIPVMHGLAGADPGAAVAAMQAINARIQTMLFAFVFFGPALLSILAALAAWSAGQPAAALLALAAALTYALGTVTVTFLVHIPLNTALAVGTGDAAALWESYAPRWTSWNHVRSIASLVAACLLMAATHLALRALKGP